MKKTLTFDDILIEPRFSAVTSRKECNTEVRLSNIILNNPIISSNMDTITSSEMTHAMADGGGIGALHRFCTIKENVEMYKKSAVGSFVSIGLGKKELDRACALFEAGATNFIIDVANGASLESVRQYRNLRNLIGETSHIMVGNFATAESIKDFVFYSESIPVSPPNSFKVGIGSGSMCTTRIVTGCGIPMLGSVIDCVTTGYDIIADGGIRNSGDIAKCLAAGAKAVMIGGILSGTLETPGDTVNYYGTKINSEEVNMEVFKKYRGSASKESYEVQGKTASHRSPEGESTLVPYKGSVAPILEQLKAGLQSAMSYVNARTLEEFRQNASFVEITGAGMAESKSHGKK